MSKIIFIDDEEEMLVEVKALLEYRGHTVLTTPNPEEGIRLISESQPEIAFIDIRIPGSNGINVLKRAKATNLKLKVIILSGYQDEANEKKAISAGANLYLRKPVGFEELENAISKVLATT